MFNSCSVEKRYHRTGFNVNWNNSTVKIKKDRNSNNSERDLNEEAILIENNISKKSEIKSLTYSDIKSNAVATVGDEPILIEENQVNESKNESLHHNIDNDYEEISSNTILQKDTKETLQVHPKVKNRIGKRTEMKDQLRKTSVSGDDSTLLYVILSFLLPPLAVYLYEGSWTKRCTINLVLTLLCGLPGVIHALIVILGGK